MIANDDFKNNAAHIVVVQNLNFSRGAKPIFRELSLHIPRGKITAIMGPSGTGKTTLLNLIGGRLQPDSGQVFVNGANVFNLTHRELYRLRRRMGILFQQGGLFTDLDVFENVAFPLREHTNLSEDMIHDLVLMNLEAVGLRGAAHLRIDQLSGGMARRVAIARAIILGPELMLYDEPFTGQDPISRGVLLQLIKQLNDAFNLSSVIVSHDVKETAEIADYIYIIFDGAVIAQGVPDQLFAFPSEQVKQFVCGLPNGAISFHYPAKDYAEDLNLC